MKHRKVNHDVPPSVPYKSVREDASINTYLYLVEHEVADRGLMDSEVYEATDAQPPRYYVRCRFCNDKLASDSTGYESLEDAQVWLEACLQRRTGHETCVEVPA